MEDLLEAIDAIKPKITSQEYIEMMASLLVIRDEYKGYKKCKITYLDVRQILDIDDRNNQKLVYIKSSVIINLEEQDENENLNNIEELNDHIGNTFVINNGIISFSSAEKCYCAIPENIDNFDITFSPMIFLKATLVQACDSLTE